MLSWPGWITDRLRNGPETSDLSAYPDIQAQLPDADLEIREKGCDEAKYVAASLDLNGQKYLLAMLCARYGDKWYNQDMPRNPSIMVNGIFEAGN